MDEKLRTLFYDFKKVIYYLIQYQYIVYVKLVKKETFLFEKPKNLQNLKNFETKENIFNEFLLRFNFI